jgi:hypothetical protein
LIDEVRMKLNSAATVLLILICGTLTAKLAAKGTTVKLVVSGGGLAAPIEITGGDVAFANPWGNSFVRAWTSIPAPPADTPLYQVSFYEELGPGNVKMMYIVEYKRNGAAGGAIHLPGHGDHRYRLNVSTILRDGQDGQWFPASDEWERVVGSRLPGARGTSQPQR